MLKRHRADDEGGESSSSSTKRKAPVKEEEVEGAAFKDEAQIRKASQDVLNDGFDKNDLFYFKTLKAGNLIKIEVTNFMCHKALTVHFNKNINFITGKSGSGKSVVVAALQVCLGRASNTHGARKLTDFIRHGCDGDAQVAVTVQNCKDGYKFDVFGDAITIRRTLKKIGSHPFQLIGSDGIVHATDKEEFDALLGLMNMQVENSCAVLDQENCARFLKGSDKDRYKFFVNAADTNRMDAKVAVIRAEYCKNDDNLRDTAKLMRRSKAEFDRLKAQFDGFWVLSELEFKVRVLKAKCEGVDLDGQPIVLDPRETKEVCLKRVIKALENLVDEQAKRKTGTATYTEVSEQCQRAKECYVEAKERIRKTQNRMDELASGVRDRVKRFQGFQRCIQRYTNAVSDQYLQQKGFSGGRVIFDREEQELRMIVGQCSPDGTLEGTAEVKMMSRNERSNAMVCILLALVRHTCSRFHIMDELDVFMHSDSRNSAITELIAYARQDVNKQFIFITPQDLSSITPADDLRIINISPSRDGQSTLTDVMASERD